MTWVPATLTQHRELGVEKELPPTSQGPWGHPLQCGLFPLSWDEDPTVLATVEGVSLKQGSTLSNCLFICRAKVNSVSSQNGKTASVPLLKHRARPLLQRDRKKRGEERERRGRERREERGAEGRGGEGRVTTGRSDSRLQRNPCILSASW